MRSSGGTSGRSERAALAALLLCAATAAAQAPAPSLRAEPENFRLWKDKAARVIVEAAGGIDALELSASLGRFDAPVRTGPAQFTAVWHPPEEGYPQLALFTAHVQTHGAWRVAHGVLPLWGLGDAVVKATPSSRIVVQIGDRKFGPVKTNAAGIARVPVEVRPGETSAWHGTREIPLGIPNGPRAQVSSRSTALFADTPTEVPVSLFVVTPAGDAIAPPQRWKVTVDRGAVSAPEPDGAGGMGLAWTVPAGAPGVVHLHAELEGDSDVAVTLELPVLERPRVQPPPVSPPAERFASVSLTPKLGVVSNFHDVSAPELGVEAQSLLRAGPGQVVLGASVGTFSFAPLGNAFGVTGDTRYLPVFAQAGYRYPLTPRLALTALAEAGAARIVDALQVPEEPRLEVAAWVPSGAVGARLEWGVWRGGAQLTVRGLWAGNPALPTLSGHFAGLSAALGYRLEVW